MSTVFIDVDTQLDFLYPAGALYVPGAERLIPTLARLTHYARHHRIPLLSTVDAHTEDDPEFRAWPKHCVAGATGQHKAEATLLVDRIVLPNRESDFEIAGAHQIVVEKQTVNAFDTHTFARLIRHLAPERFVVYGVVTEICVGHAVRGLLQFGKPVTVAIDAIQALSAEASRTTLDDFRGAGVQLATASEITGV
jgi:nicotinamidase/pyrazinamidase